MERNHCLYRRIKFFKGFQTRFSHYLFFFLLFCCCFFFCPTVNFGPLSRGQSHASNLNYYELYVFGLKVTGSLVMKMVPWAYLKTFFLFRSLVIREICEHSFTFGSKKKKKICKEHHQLKLKACRINAYRTVTYEFFPQALALYLLLKP